MQNVLKQLHIQPDNFGGSSGYDRWTGDKSLGAFASYSPINEQKIANIYRVTLTDYETIIQTAQQAFYQWREVPAPKRGELVRQIGQLLRENKEALGSLICYEMGKTKQEADGEVQEMIDMADLAVGQSRMLYGLAMHSERSAHRMFEQWHPFGIVGVISSFNFPVAVWAWNAFIAAICGNTVVWKPSSKTPLCAIAVQHLCNQVMQQNGHSGIFSTIISDQVELVESLVSDRRVALVSFTGSTVVGKRVAEKVAKRFGRCLLECSGNNAVIVDASADLQLALPAIIFGAIGTAGQRCTTTRRLIIHQTLYQEIIDRLVATYANLTIGNPLDEKNFLGPLIDHAAVLAYQQAIKTAKQLGGQIYAGGNVLAGPGFYVEPTIIAAQNDWDIVQKETFVPILYVMPYDTIEEAIALNNDVCQGLSSAIFTQNLQHAEQFLAVAGSDCGIANVNLGTSGAEIGGAFGGEKATGGGREAGSDAWKAYMRRQTVTINGGKALPLAQGIRFPIIEKLS